MNRRNQGVAGSNPVGGTIVLNISKVENFEQILTFLSLRTGLFCMTAVLGIVSGKGGCGKTTTSANLSIALADNGYKVTAVDGNITTPNLGIHFGMPICPITLHDVIKGRVDVGKAIYKHPSGVDFVPAGLSVDDTKNVRPEKFYLAIKQLFGRDGIVVIDGAAGLGREARTSMALADGLLIVTNPEMPAVADALKAIKLAELTDKPVFGVVLNRVNGHAYEMSKKEVEEMLGIPILGEIPDDKNIPASIAAHMPVVKFKPRSKSARAFKKLAANIMGDEHKEERGFSFLWWR